MRKFSYLFLVLLGLIGFSQNDPDSTRIRIFQPALYFDYGKAMSSVSANSSKIEGGLEFVFGEKWQVIGEYGQWQMNPPQAIESGDYLVEGNYFRLGLGFIPYVDSESRIGLGFRYARSEYGEEGSYTLDPDSGFQGSITEPFRRNGLTADWYELVFYSDKKLNKRITFGFTARWRFSLVRQEFQAVDTQIIPGYGNTQSNQTGALNLFLKIPF